MDRRGIDPRARRVARRAVLAAAWVVATVLAATVAWGAVARLGRVGADVTTPMSGTEVERALAERSPSTSGPTHRSATGPPGPISGAPPSRHPTPSGGPSPRRFTSWTVSGGFVGASCRGAVIALAYATPRDGWVLSAPATQTPRLTVTFSRGTHVSVLTATCRDGVPSGTVEERSAPGGGTLDDGSTDGGDG